MLLSNGRSSAAKSGRPLGASSAASTSGDASTARRGASAACTTCCAASLDEANVAPADGTAIVGGKAERSAAEGAVR
jgi:hypothetical protein